MQPGQSSLPSNSVHMQNNNNSTARIANIVVFGEAGAGKSSVINLVAGQQLARTSNSALGCTSEHRSYDVAVDGIGCRVWDTIGLNEGSEGMVPADAAQRNLKALIEKTLGGPRGIDLLICCSRSGSAIKGLRSVYHDIYSGVCKKKVPIALVVTYCEYLEPKMETWWDSNKAILRRLGMQFDAHACITTLELEDGLIQSQRLYSQKLLRDIVLGYSKRPPIPLDTADRQPDRKPTLLDPTERPRTNQAAPLRSLKPKTIVFFGETGAGKSSVINLIANEHVAQTSPGADACTFGAKSYHILLKPGMDIRIYDTVGLEQPEMDINGFFQTVQKAHSLVSELSAAGGIDLLVFCMRATRITTALQRTYRLFYEILCEKQVPLALVITHLEAMENMEDWWTENERVFKKYGIHVTHHACITAVPARLTMFADKRAQSRRAVIDLLSRVLDDSTPYLQATHGWFMSLVGFLQSFPKDGSSPDKEKLSKKLEQQCALPRADAERLADVICASRR